MTSRAATAHQAERTGSEIVHHLHQGVTLCNMRGLPCDWPKEHLWSSDWRDVNCVACNEAHQILMSRIPVPSHLPEYIELIFHLSADVAHFNGFSIVKAGGRFALGDGKKRLLTRVEVPGTSAGIRIADGLVLRHHGSIAKVRFIGLDPALLPLTAEYDAPKMEEARQTSFVTSAMVAWEQRVKNWWSSEGEHVQRVYRARQAVIKRFVAIQAPSELAKAVYRLVAAAVEDGMNEKIVWEHLRVMGTEALKRLSGEAIE